jgi:hypothetical protein
MYSPHRVSSPRPSGLQRSASTTTLPSAPQYYKTIHKQNVKSRHPSCYAESLHTLGQINVDIVAIAQSVQRWDTGGTDGFRFPVGERFFFSPYRPDPFSDSFILLSNVYEVKWTAREADDPHPSSADSFILSNKKYWTASVV